MSATGSRLLGTPREDVAFVTLEFGESILAHVHVSWINPQKIRSLTVVGSQRMVVWDDMQPLEPIRVYDKGVMEEPYYDSFGESPVAPARRRYRDSEAHPAGTATGSGRSLHSPADVGRADTKPSADSGVRVVACLEAVQQSLREEGRRVAVNGVAVA